MFAVIYRWRVRPGADDRFVDGWSRVTRAIHAQCGSYGSRLHRAADGTWVAYAVWPDAQTRERCTPSEPEGGRLMREAIEESFPETPLTVTVDLIAEPGAA